jgi:hypothetical protein
MLDRRLENLLYLSLGILFVFVLDHHFIGRGVAYTCEAIIPRKKDFLFEILFFSFCFLPIFGIIHLKQTKPITAVFGAIFFILALAYMMNSNSGNLPIFSDLSNPDLKVEKVWDSGDSEESSKPHKSAGGHSKWHKKSLPNL